MNTRSLLDNISPANFILLLASQLRKLAFEDRCSVVDFFLFMKFKGGHLTPLQIVSRSPSILRGAIGYIQLQVCKAYFPELVSE